VSNDLGHSRKKMRARTAGKITKFMDVDSCTIKNEVCEQGERHDSC
jgi:hypothetical protein